MPRVLGLWFLLLCVVVTAGWAVSRARRRGWAGAEATVLEVTPVRNPHVSTYHVRARLRLPDGRQLEGASQDSHEAHRWTPGTVRPAWYDPADPARFTLEQPPGRGRGSGRGLPVVMMALFVVVGLALALTGCTGPASSSPRADGAGTAGTTPSGTTPPAATTAASGGAGTATGWARRSVPGVSLEVPAAWQDRPADQRNSAATLEVGEPFTGQPVPPPVLEVFVESGPVGTLQIRAALLRAQLKGELGAGASVGKPRPAPVPGASALVMDVRYTSTAGESSLGTTLRATPILQRELLVEPPAPAPRFGLRMAAPAGAFDEAVWAHVVSSLRFGDPATPGGGSG